MIDENKLRAFIIEQRTTKHKTIMQICRACFEILNTVVGDRYVETTLKDAGLLKHLTPTRKT